MTLRFGITASRRVGNAVARNRVRRRLRAAAESVLPKRAKPGYDYVLIGRAATLQRPWLALLADLTEALRRLRVLREEGPSSQAEGLTREIGG